MIFALLLEPTRSRTQPICDLYLSALAKGVSLKDEKRSGLLSKGKSFTGAQRPDLLQHAILVCEEM